MWSTYKLGWAVHQSYLGKVYSGVLVDLKPFGLH